MTASPSAPPRGFLLRALTETFDHLNGVLFGWGLRPPQFAIVSSASRLGAWHPASRTLELSLSLIEQHPWVVVAEVMKHEMAHQYVHEVLGVSDETAHGPAFRRVCARFAIQFEARGLPAARMSPEEARVLERIQKLLALASSDNEHESQNAAAAAQRLMQKYNAEPQQGPAPEFATRTLGAPTTRVQPWQRVIGRIVLDHFFVSAVWAPTHDVAQELSGTVLEICGTPVNVDIAEYVYAFLVQAGDACWEKYRRQTKGKSTGGRGAYLAGLFEGFREKLELERESDRVAARARGAELVWVGEDSLQEYVTRRYPSLRSVRRQTARRSEAWAQGRVEGKSLQLRRGVASGSPASSGPSSGIRLLGAGRTTG